MGVKGSNFEIRIEYSKEYFLVHLPYVNGFNKGTFHELSVLLDDWNEFVKTVGYEGIHAAVDVNNLKIIRLITKLGFKPLGNSGSFVVYKYEV